MCPKVIRQTDSTGKPLVTQVTYVNFVIGPSPTPGEIFHLSIPAVNQTKNVTDVTVRVLLKNDQLNVNNEKLDYFMFISYNKLIYFVFHILTR